MAHVSFDLNLSALMAVLFGVTLTRFAVMGHYALHRKVYPGFTSFILAEFFALLAMLAVVLRASWGELLPLVFLTGVGTVLQPVAAYHGLGVFGRAPRLAARSRQNIALAALVALGYLADLLLEPNMVRRGLIFLAIAFIVCARTGLELLLICRRPLTGFRLLCASYLVVAAIHAARVWDLLGATGYDYGSMMLSDRLLAAFVFARILQSVLELYVVFSMNSQMLEDDLRQATAQIERMASTDALTGVLNRRGLAALGADALRRSQRRRRPSSVIMLDLDWFKQVNDTLGHVAGDALLKALALLCARSLREDDVFARFGGEEFVVVAPYTGSAEALQLAERIRLAVESEHFEATGGARVTASFGVASSRTASLEELLGQADTALYAAKQGGRNRVELAIDLAAEPA